MIKYDDIEDILDSKLKTDAEGNIIDKDEAVSAIMDLIRKGPRLGMEHVVSELDTFESVSFERMPVNMVKVTLHIGEDAEDMPGWADSSVLPMDHHCDPERLVDLIKFLRNRMRELYNC